METELIIDQSRHHMLLFVLDEKDQTLCETSAGCGLVHTLPSGLYEVFAPSNSVSG